MVFAYISTNYCRDERVNPPHPAQKTAKALLSSLIADGDVVTDWMYFFEIYTNNLSNDINIPQSLMLVQLISCICGTMSWFIVATDGRAIQWIRILFSTLLLLVIWAVALTTSFLVTLLLFPFTRKFVDTFEGTIDKILGYFGLEKMTNFLVKRITLKLPFASGSLLLMGVLLEDVPQLVVTFLIEESIKSDRPNGGISSAALINLLFASFDILHKLAEAWDLRMDIQNVAYTVIRSIKAHSSYVYSLVGTTSDWIISTSLDGTVKLWDMTKGKCLHKFKCTLPVHDAIPVGNSKVIAACEYGLKILDSENDSEEDDSTNNRIVTGFDPLFISTHPDNNSFFISGKRAKSIQQRNLNSYDNSFEIIFQYNRPATSIAFVTNGSSFVSCCNGSKDLHIWKMNQDEPLHTLKLANPISDYTSCGTVVLSMSSSLFLAADGECIKSYILSNDDGWEYNAAFRHGNDRVHSLAKVDDELFVSTSFDGTAKLWSIFGTKAKNDYCLFTFQGHRGLTNSINSCIYLKEEQAVATGDSNGLINVWSIAKFVQDRSDKDDDGHHEEP